MMSTDSYISIADALGNLYVLGSQSVSNLNAIPTILSKTSVPAAQAGLSLVLAQRAASVAATITAKHVVVSSSLNALVVALQSLVVEDSGTVDDYLLANDLLVSNDFATLSGLCGYSISSFNIRT